MPARVPDLVASGFARRLGRLDEGCRATLLVAAVAAGDLRVTTDACRRLGLDPAALSEAEDARLVEVHGGRVAFRHPLARAAAYSAASARERHASHRAVAEALPPEDGDRRAWHLSEAVWHPDAEIATLMADVAERAAARAAYAVASGAWERSARLAPELTVRASRLLEAADTAWSAGMAARTVALLDEHAREHGGGRVRELVLRATIAARGGAPGDALDLLLTAAERSGSPDEETLVLADAVHGPSTSETHAAPPSWPSDWPGWRRQSPNRAPARSG